MTLLHCVTGIVMTVVLCALSACSSSAPRSFAPADPLPLSEFSYQYLESGNGLAASEHESR